MTYKALRSWLTVATLGVVAVACSDRNEQTAPLVPAARQFTTAITAPHTEFTINGAKWQSTYDINVGTGVIDPFLSIQNNPSEEGFNTDTSSLPLNDTRPSFTDALPLNNVPIIFEAGGHWREFILDANESNSLPDGQFSIDLFDVWVCHDSNAKTYGSVAAFEGNSACVKVYNITDNGKAPLQATDAATSGSGSSLDYRILIPADAFGSAANAACAYNPNGADCGYYIVVHAKMGFSGGDWATGATFEEMSTIKRPALQISKTPDGQTVNAGNSISFSITVTNTGAGTASAVMIYDTLPSGGGISWSTASAGCAVAGSPQVLSCNVGDLGEGASFTATVTSATTGASCGVYDNRAWFSSTSVLPDNDTGQITVANCTGSVRIVKVSLGGDSTFQFTGGGTGVDANFALTTSSGKDSVTFSNIPTGLHTVAESGPYGSWEFVSLACTNLGAGGSSSGQGAVIDVQLGVTSRCVFTNQKKGRITIVKNTVGGDNTFDYSSTIPGGATFQLTTVSGTASTTYSLLSPGSYSVSESNPTPPWKFVSLSCTTGGSASNRTANIELPAGGDVTCTYTNELDPELRVKKVVNGADKAFTFTPTGWNGGATFTRSNADPAFSSGIIPAGTYSVAESLDPDYTLDSIVCTKVSGPGAVSYSTGATSASVQLAAGQIVECTFTNTQKSLIVVEKQVIGASAQTFTFTRKVGSGGGYVADLGDNPAPTLSAGQTSSSGRKLVAGTYQVCETNLAAGWVDPTMTVNGAGASVSTDGAGNFCTTFALGVGDSIKVVVTNTPPPGGGTRTIGYWKNWSSCAQSNGGQYTKAVNASPSQYDKTLDGNLPQTLGTWTIPVEHCDWAVNILSKNARDGAKRAGDAIYGMSAQLLAALLNLSAGAGSCSALSSAVTDAQSILTTLGFDGTGAYKNSPYAAQANALASVLDKYNNGVLGGGCPNHI